MVVRSQFIPPGRLIVAAHNRDNYFHQQNCTKYKLHRKQFYQPLRNVNSNRWSVSDEVQYPLISPLHVYFSRETTALEDFWNRVKCLFISVGIKRRSKIKCANESTADMKSAIKEKQKLKAITFSRQKIKLKKKKRKKERKTPSRQTITVSTSAGYILLLTAARVSRLQQCPFFVVFFFFYSFFSCFLLLCGLSDHRLFFIRSRFRKESSPVILLYSEKQKCSWCDVRNIFL